MSDVWVVCLHIYMWMNIDGCICRFAWTYDKQERERESFVSLNIFEYIWIYLNGLLYRIRWQGSPKATAKARQKPQETPRKLDMLFVVRNGGIGKER